jgi:hypothetical protein
VTKALQYTSLDHAVMKAQRDAREARAAVMRAAQDDPVLFAAAVMRDEKTGRGIHLAPMHEEWHDLIDRHDRLVIWSHVEGGKTAQIAVCRTLYELGRNPDMRGVVVSNASEQAKKIVRPISQYLRKSAELREVFPRLRPSEPWTQTSITVERGSGNPKDPSVQALGVHGNVMGARIDWLILDDVLDFENTRTAAGRKDLIDWFENTLFGRLTEHAKVVVIGNAYHPEDLLHHLAAKPRFVSRRYPVVLPDGTPRWPEKWSLQRIEQARQDWVPAEFARQLMCVSRSDESSRFKREWVDRCLKRGEGREMAFGLEAVPPGCRTITGVDLAVQQKDSADLTVLFSIVVHPDETREVLWVDAGRWTAPEILSRVADHHRRYHSLVMVENNAAQEYLLQFARAGTAIPVRGFTTGRTKAHPEFGVEGLAAEMHNGKWIIPNKGGRMEREVGAWVGEMLHYDPSAHTGDRLMASWFAREGARLGSLKVEQGRLDLTRR